jgi:hypothetical protein
VIPRSGLSKRGIAVLERLVRTVLILLLAILLWYAELGFAKTAIVKHGSSDFSLKEASPDSLTLGTGGYRGYTSAAFGWNFVNIFDTRLGFGYTQKSEGGTEIEYTLELRRYFQGEDPILELNLTHPAYKEATVPARCH